MKIPSSTMLNATLTQTCGQPVILFEVIEVQEGESLAIVLETWRRDRHQGIWFGLEGVGELNGIQSPQFEVWAGDDRPRAFNLSVVSTNDGLLRLYNLYDRGQGRMSQGHTSGMLREVDGPRSRYRCTDFGFEPAFDSLVFTITRGGVVG